MGPSADLETAVRQLASGQDRLFTDKQVQDLGASRYAVRYRVRAGHWERVLPRVLTLPGTPITPGRQARAACMSLAHMDVLACMQSAAALRGLQGVECDEPHVLVVGARPSTDGIKIHYAPSIPDQDRSVVDGVPTTSADRMFLDVAGVVPEELLSDWLDDAVRRGLVSVARLRWRVAGARQGHRGVRVLRRLIDELARDGVPASKAERELRRIIRVVGLPKPVYEYVIKKKRRQIRGQG